MAGPSTRSQTAETSGNPRQQKRYYSSDSGAEAHKQKRLRVSKSEVDDSSEYEASEGVEAHSEVDEIGGESQEDQPRSPPARASKASNRRPLAKSESHRKLRSLPSTFDKTTLGKLAPLTDLSNIFEHMANKAFKDLGLAPALVSLGNREIRIATMCSGTESPLLALQMLSDGLERSHGIKIRFKHCFSAEIVPHIQAYIERNFRPDIIFRDILELENETASTAYGGHRPVPRVDAVIAGFSCVDFSRLNRHNVKLEEQGESGRTFGAILQYAKDKRPAIVILENVQNQTPWDSIKAIWENDKDFLAQHAVGFKDFWDVSDPGYAAVGVSVDTKEYYLPQTRKRGYMICVDRKRHKLADKLAGDWSGAMFELRRPASAPVEAFLLDEDDARLHRAKNELHQTIQKRAGVDWVLSQSRHQTYRTENKLGMERPITRWKDGGSCQTQDYWWKDWNMKQVERLWDTYDIAYLRNASNLQNSLGSGFDAFYKPRTWELSQNIDRDLDGAPWGITGCITPTGQAFLTTRGGPIIGLEALALQGLPINKLLLTRESQKELQDLAGNAMSSTVVGAAILAAFSTCYKVFLDLQEHPTVVEEIQPLTKADNMLYDCLQEPCILEIAGFEYMTTTNLCDLAKASASLCPCEGQSSLAASIFRCQDCGHSACTKCRGLPPHNYSPHPHQASTRMDPLTFRKVIKRSLPMQVVIMRLVEIDRVAFAKVSPDLFLEDWEIFVDAIIKASGDKLCFTNVRRSHNWTVSFEGIYSRLDLSFADGKAEWQLFGKPDRTEPGNSRKRQLLNHPLARMHPSDDNILEGVWKICVPILNAFDINVKGQGDLRKCWEASLGIEQEGLAEKKVWSQLTVSVGSALQAAIQHDIAGTYEHLPNCGTASGGLHKRTVAHSALLVSPTFLFLDPERIGRPEDDCFVVAKTIHKRRFQETRNVIAELDSTWRPSDTQDEKVSCTAHGRWIGSEAVLQPFQTMRPATYQVPKPELAIPLYTKIQANSSSSPMHHTCTDGPTAILSCEVPLTSTDQFGWSSRSWTLINYEDQRQVFLSFTWLTTRARDLGNFSDKWRVLEIPENPPRCLGCGPEKPGVRWRYHKLPHFTRIVAYEDGKQAGNFERAIKARPTPFVVQTKIDEQKMVGCLVIGLNLATLVHRLLAMFIDAASDMEVSVDYRLDPQYEEQTALALKPFKLLDNTTDPQLPHQFMALREEDGIQQWTYAGELWPWQQRSFKWMVGQEDPKALPFFEQEIEEATLPELGWRVEVRAKKPNKALGGLLADKVGYGKTATILALVDRQMHKAEERTESPCKGYIPLKATLIILPPFLTQQWTREVNNFFGEKYRVVTIAIIKDLDATTIAKLKKADIVIVCWDVFNKDPYLRKMGFLGSLPEGPASGGSRAFKTWLRESCANMESRTEELKGKSPSELFKDLVSRFKIALSDEDLLHHVPSRRVKGSKYRSQTDKEPDGAKPLELPDVENLRPYPLRQWEDVENVDEATGSVLHMFRWDRLVLDEQTYVNEEQFLFINLLKSERRWTLSGTPRIDDFAEIHRIARFLGINLGIEDDAAGVLKANSIQNIRKDRTAAETFNAFQQSRTVMWHQARQDHAQNFCDQFIRQNPNPHKLPLIVMFRPFELLPVEKIVYIELQSLLQMTEMRIVHKRRPNDEERQQSALGDSNTPQEALLRCGSYLPNANIGLDGMISDRRNIRARLTLKLEDLLRHAEWLRRQLTRSKIPREQDKHFTVWVKDVSSGSYGDAESSHKIRALITAAQGNYEDAHENLFYRDGPPEDGKKGGENFVKNKALTQKRKAEEVELQQVQKKRRTGKKPPEDGDDVPPEDDRPFKIPHDDFPRFVKELRVLTRSLRTLSTEYVSRTRSLRFAKSARNFQNWLDSEHSAPKCAKCGIEAQAAEDFFINVTCGHCTCRSCVEAGRSSNCPDECVIDGCIITTEEFRLPSVATLVRKVNPWDSQDTNYGSKMRELVSVINGTPRDDQILIFVQFYDAMTTIEAALNDAGISYYAFTTANITSSPNMVTNFQEIESSDRRKVAVLCSSDESSAGINLFNANHVIFFSPPCFETQYDYDQSMSQCLGRAARYGQQKMVTVHKLVALKTIDVDIYEEREERRLVYRPDAFATGSFRGRGDWKMLPEDEITFREKETDWGTGFHIKSSTNPEY